jgi:hypothetical protein
MKCSKYCTTYETNRQLGSYQGIDTCDVTNFGYFSFLSILLDRYESMSIVHHFDINTKLTNLEHEGVITNYTADGMRKQVMELHKNGSNSLRSYYNGAMHMTLHDAMSTQKEIGDEQLLNVIYDEQRMRNGINLPNDDVECSRA